MKALRTEQCSTEHPFLEKDVNTGVNDLWSCAVRSYGTDYFPLIISDPPTFEWLQKSSNAAGRIFVHLLLPRKPLLLLSFLSPSLFPPPTLHTGTHSSDHWGTRYWQRGSHGWTPPVAAAAAAAQ